MLERKPLWIALSLCLSLTAVAACGGDDDDDDDVVDVDASVNMPDAAGGDPDAAGGDPDASGIDAPAGEPLQVARDSADGAVSIEIPNVLVTYRKPALGSDGPGFFVQKEQAGPALFIAVDPCTLTPEPMVGDEVTFTIDTMGTSAQLRQAEAISGFSVDSSGNDVSALAQDLSAVSNISASIDDYESELVTFTATDIAGAFNSAGSGHESAELAASPADSNLRMRLPATLRDFLDLETGCDVTFTAPMWRFFAQAQPSPYDPADFAAVAGCPAPVLESAVALSDTAVRLTFSRRIDDASISDAPTQFTIDGGLTVSAASVSGRTVDLTTSAQVGGTVYTVTVADTVTDIYGTGVPAGGHTATFTGFVVLADLIISELNANISGACDLLELRVLASGSLDGFEVFERETSVVTFSGLTVTAGDIIVIHWNSGSCNETSATDETAAIDEQPASTHPRNYDTAWDWYTADTSFTNTENVITVFNNAGDIVDAVLVTDDPTRDASALASEAAAATVAAAGEWEMVGGGVPSGGFVDLDFNMHAVPDLDATGTSPAGESILRLAGDDTNNLTDWTQAASSWGALNCPAAAPTGGRGLVFEHVDTATGEITIRNISGGAIDIGSGTWQFCASFVYDLLTGTMVTVVSGDLNLADGEAVTVRWDRLVAADTDLGLYDSGAFADAASMQAFTQWDSGGHGRESVAVTAGLWTAGDFVDRHGADAFTATGDVTASTGYTRTEAACLP